MPKNPLKDQVVALSYAHMNGDVIAISELIASHPELARMAPDMTWLHRAAKYGQIAVIDFWLRQGWDVNTNLYEGSNVDGVAAPLHFAKDVATTKFLIAHGATVNAWTRYGGTPLHNAVVRNDVQQIHALLQAGADPAIADCHGATPLALAVSLYRSDSERALREAGSPKQGRRPTCQPSKPPAIDLRKDAKQITSTLRSAIRKVSREISGSQLTSVFLAVSGIEGYVMVAFDTSGADNPWDASYSEYAYKRFDKWRYAYELVAMGAEITQVNGRAVSWSKGVGDVKFEQPFFDACVAVLKLAEESSFFDCLPRAARFRIGVEAPLSGKGRSWVPRISRSK